MKGYLWTMNMFQASVCKHCLEDLIHCDFHRCGARSRLGFRNSYTQETIFQRGWCALIIAVQRQVERAFYVSVLHFNVMSYPALLVMNSTSISANCHAAAVTHDINLGLWNPGDFWKTRKLFYFRPEMYMILTNLKSVLLSRFDKISIQYISQRT